MTTDIKAVAQALGAGGLCDALGERGFLLAATTCGLHARSVEHLWGQLFPGELSAGAAIIDEDLVRLRRRPELLTLVEPDWLLRLAALWVDALSAFGGAAAARNFLLNPRAECAGLAPLEVASRSGLGAEQLRAVFGTPAGLATLREGCLGHPEGGAHSR